MTANDEVIGHVVHCAICGEFLAFVRVDEQRPTPVCPKGCKMAVAKPTRRLYGIKSE